MSDEHVDEAAVILRSACQYVKIGEWAQYLGLSDPAMTRVAKFEKHDMTIPICIIGLEDYVATPNANLARFDFGCCMAAFDGVQPIRSQEFDRDVKAQSLHAAPRRQPGAVRLLDDALREDYDRSLRCLVSGHPEHSSRRTSKRARSIVIGTKTATSSKALS